MAQQEWFIVRDGGTEEGPFSGQQLKHMAASGRLKKSDLVRRGDAQTAKRASDIKGLFPDATATPAGSTPAAAPTEPSSATSRFPKKTVIIAAVVLGASLLLCCGVVGIFFVKDQQAAKKELAEADALWDKGDKAGASAKYRAILTTSGYKATLKDDERARVYGRLIDFDFEAGNTDSAKALLAEASKSKITPAVNHPDAKALVAAEQAHAGPSSKKDYGLDPAIETANDVLNSKFLPRVPGSTKRYEEETIDKASGRPLVSSEYEEVFGDDGRIRVEGTMKSPGQPPSKFSQERQVRVAAGFVETKIDKNAPWKRLIKLGAKPGDTWPDGANTGFYQFVRFQKQRVQGAKGPDEVQQALLEHHYFYAPKEGGGDQIETVIEIVLERDGGVESEKEYSISRGQKKLVRHKRLVSGTK